MIASPKLRRVLLGFVLVALAVGVGGRTLGATALAQWAWQIPAIVMAAVVAVDFLSALRRGVFGVDVIAFLAEVIRDVPVAEVMPKVILFVRPGEAVPVDGVRHGASAVLDESPLTGVPVPVTREVGDAVRSGVSNACGPFTMRATATAGQSTFAAVIRLVRAAERDRPQPVRLADRYALDFLASTLALASLAGFLARDPTRAIAVLVVATPCPLILADPVALIAGVSRAARRGVMIKGGGRLERLARPGDPVR